MTTAPVLDYGAAERARLVTAERAALVASGGAVTTELFARATRRTLEAARQWVQRRRRTGRLITVTYNGGVLIPTFQLTEAFEHDEVAGDIVGLLGGHGMSEWAVWDWFVTPNTWLDGTTPADAMTAGRDGDVRRAVAGMFQE